MTRELTVTLRRLRHSPVYCAALVGILAFGIAAATTMLSVLNALIWRQVDVADPHTLVAVSSVNVRDVPRVMPLGTLAFLEQPPLNGQAWCAYNAITETTGPDGLAVDAYVGLLSSGCPALLGVAPVLGRWFESHETRITGTSHPVAVISHRYWRRVFNEDPAVIGRRLRMFNATVEVIGVLPDRFRGLSRDYDTDIFVPFNAHRPASTALTFLTRLRDGESLESFRAKVVAAWPSILLNVLPPGPAAQQALKELRGSVAPLDVGFSRLRTLYGSATAALSWLSLALLLLICLNVGGLFVSRWGARRSEIATMKALGAGAPRIAGMVLAEAGVLVASAAACGIPLAYLATSAIGQLLPVEVLPQAIDLRPDASVVASVLIGTIFLAAVISAFPIRSLGRVRGLDSSDRTVVRTTTVATRVLLVAQVALTLSLVVTSALVLRSLNDLWASDRGFRSANVLSARLFPNPGSYQGLDQLRYYPELIGRIAGIPGVQSVGAARYFGTIDVPLTSGQPVAFDGVLEATTTAFLEFVSPRFFATLDIPVQHGRDLAWTDVPTTTPVALVSDSLASALGSNAADLVGRTVRLGSGPSAPRLLVVGVVGNVSLGNFRQADARIIYRSGLQAGQATMSTIHVRTDGATIQLANAITGAVDSFGYEHVIGPHELDRLFANSLVAERMGAWLGAGQALLAILVSCVGLYSLIAQTVIARRKEIGVRLALGAPPVTVWRQITRSGVLLVVAGIVAGYPVTLATGSVVGSLLFGISSRDVLTFSASAALLLLSGIAASSIPAWRATRIDPVEALRQP